MSEKRKTPKRAGKNVNVWMDDELKAALDRFMDGLEIRPSITSVVELAVKEFLVRKGEWPPKDAGGEDSEG